MIRVQKQLKKTSLSVNASLITSVINFQCVHKPFTKTNPVELECVISKFSKLTRNEEKVHFVSRVVPKFNKREGVS